jgi:hypothetical protein
MTAATDNGAAFLLADSPGMSIAIAPNRGPPERPAQKRSSVYQNGQ